MCGLTIIKTQSMMWKSPLPGSFVKHLRTRQIPDRISFTLLLATTYNNKSHVANSQLTTHPLDSPLMDNRLGFTSAVLPKIRRQGRFEPLPEILPLQGVSVARYTQSPRASMFSLYCSFESERSMITSRVAPDGNATYQVWAYPTLTFATVPIAGLHQIACSAELFSALTMGVARSSVGEQASSWGHA